MPRNKGDVLKTSATTSITESSFFNSNQLQTDTHHSQCWWFQIFAERNVHAPLPPSHAEGNHQHLWLCPPFWEGPAKALAVFFSPTYSFLLVGRGAGHLVNWSVFSSGWWCHHALLPHLPGAPAFRGSMVSGLSSLASRQGKLASSSPWKAPGAGCRALLWFPCWGVCGTNLCTSHWFSADPTLMWTLMSTKFPRPRFRWEFSNSAKVPV